MVCRKVRLAGARTQGTRYGAPFLARRQRAHEEPTPPTTTSRLPAVTLMLGNVITGIAILAPSGMLAELRRGSPCRHPRDQALLVTLGAVILLLGSPLVAWATSHIDRRKLLADHCRGDGDRAHRVGLRSELRRPDLCLRLVMLAVAAIYTPQAAGTISLIVPKEARQRDLLRLPRLVAVGRAGLPLVTFPLCISAGR